MKGKTKDNGYQELSEKGKEEGKGRGGDGGGGLKRRGGRKSARVRFCEKCQSHGLADLLGPDKK